MVGVFPVCDEVFCPAGFARFSSITQRNYTTLTSPAHSFSAHIRCVPVRTLPTIAQLRRNPRKTPKVYKKPIEKCILRGPQRKGMVVKLVIRTPKKPNSAQRKCVILRFTNGQSTIAYIAGEKGQVQEHGVVLIEGGRVQDCPGVNYKVIRKKFDIN